MQTLESARRRIQTAEELYSVVKTMKALAAASIRHYENLVKALDAYKQTVDLGLQLALQTRRVDALPSLDAAVDGRVGALVFGSDQGLCGRFNERIVAHTITTLNGLHVAHPQRRIAAIGMRSAMLLDEAGQELSAVYRVPGGVAGIAETMSALLGTLESWRGQEGVERILLFHNRPVGGATFNPVTVQLLPLDNAWLVDLQTRPWPTRILPTFHNDWQDLFSALIRQQMFVTLYRGRAESMTSEEASRLTSMQNAERNIDSRLKELRRQYHHERQASIMAELLDISAGYEAVEGAGPLSIR